MNVMRRWRWTSQRPVVALFAIGLSVGACASDSEDQAATTVADWSCGASKTSETPTRRLTRFEYTNIVADVFGLDLDLEFVLPRDEIALGFDNQAGALTVTDLHVEAYLKAAQLVAQAVVDTPERVRTLAGCSATTRACAQRTARALGRELLRRPLSDTETDSLISLFDNDFGPLGFSEGLYRTVAVLLQSPHFLYRFERQATETMSADSDAAHQAPEATVTLAPNLMASRLAFYFWGSTPDTELLDVAEAGGLSTRSEVQQQAWRLLDDPRARRGVLHFFEQWLDLANFDEVEKDRRLLSAWDDDVRNQLASETAHFLRAVLWEDDARFSTLMLARYTVVSPRLMDFYGLPITTTDPDVWERVNFSRDEHRVGLLTQGSLLSHLAKANQTSPIHRGKFVRERFFCTTPPPPPPNIVVAAPTVDPRKTTRERFEEHRANPTCAACHELIDPIGLAFENYDAVGQYREEEAGKPVDATGYLIETDVDGPIEGVSELASRLVESSQVRRCMVTQVFRYAMGRGETEADSCTLDKLEQQYLATNGDLRELLVAVTQTDPFTAPARVPAKEEMDP